MRRAAAVVVGIIGVVVQAASRTTGAPASTRPSGGVIIEQDSTVARQEAGPHNGGGETTAYPFFADAEELALVFRKRALHPGASIGYHRNDADEIYYVLSGHGELTVDGVRHEVGPGTAILTRPGSSHGLRQLGREDLVILINYASKPSERSGATRRTIFTDTALYQQVCTQADSGLTPAAGRCTPRDQGVRRRKP
jgi:quercetin dioxygenase-like cupin family protein